MRRSRGPACLLGPFLLLAQPAIAAPAENILYAYSSGEEGGNPTGLTADGHGHFYTPLVGLGLFGGVGRLDAPKGNGHHWHPEAIFSFQGSDGSFPLGNALVAKDGSLFVTAFSGGVSNLGTVVELTPPAKGTKAWNRTVLYSFPAGMVGWGPNGAAPMAGLIQDHDRNLFTTTAGGGRAGAGAVIELSPPRKGGSSWTERPIYSFQGHTKDGAGPENTPVMDPSGRLYVTTSGGGTDQFGTVVMLSPPAKGHGEWAETILHSFTGADGNLPETTPILDKAGNIYVGTFEGGTDNGGTIVELSPPTGGGTAWTSTVLYNFGPAGPRGLSTPDALLLDAAGNLFVTTSQGGANGTGTLIELTPPASGQSGWTEATLYSFGAWPDAANPRGGMLVDGNGNIYTATYEGGPDQFFGTIDEFSGTGFVLPGGRADHRN